MGVESTCDQIEKSDDFSRFENSPHIRNFAPIHPTEKYYKAVKKLQQTICYLCEQQWSILGATDTEPAQLGYAIDLEPLIVLSLKCGSEELWTKVLRWFRLHAGVVSECRAYKLLDKDKNAIEYLRARLVSRFSRSLPEIGSPEALQLRMRMTFQCGTRADIIRVMLCRFRPMFTKEIAEDAGFDPASCSIALRELHKAGIIEGLENKGRKFYRLKNRALWAKIFEPLPTTIVLWHSLTKTLLLLIDELQQDRMPEELRKTIRDSGFPIIPSANFPDFAERFDSWCDRTLGRLARGEQPDMGSAAVINALDTETDQEALQRLFPHITEES